MCVLTFGEVMLRLVPPFSQRLAQSLPGTLDVTFGGAESNVAITLAQLGRPAAYCTSLPDNSLTDAFVGELRRHGVDGSRVLRRPYGRFGTYFIEMGASQRPDVVTYDRDGSAIALAEPTAYDWRSLLAGVTWLHITGITSGLSQSAAAATLACARAAQERGIPVSCDLNLRRKLWRWETSVAPLDLARRELTRLLELASVVITSPADAGAVLGMEVPGTNLEEDTLDEAACRTLAGAIAQRFPQLTQIALTLRTTISASETLFGGALYETGSKSLSLAPFTGDGCYEPYRIAPIVDRIGAGDGFAAGLIHALRTPELRDGAMAIRYATALGCLKHSVRGDYYVGTHADVMSLVEASRSGRVQR